MGLNRFYRIKDMATFPDKFEDWDGVSAFKFVGTVPTWFQRSLMSPLFPDLYYPTFTIQVPNNTTGTFTVVVEKYSFPAGVLLESGTVNIFVQPWGVATWNVDQCNSATLAWLNPIGGWESYTFTGTQQPFTDKGSAQTFINYRGEKRYASRDEVHQGVMQSTGNLNAIHSRQIADLFKTIQAYIITADGTFPIIIEPSSFRQVKSNEPWASYEFEYRLAEEDVIQTQ